MDTRKYISKKKNIIDKALDKYIPLSKVRPNLLHKAMRYSVFPGGKRIRPILAIASFEACGGKDNSILPVASAIELIHSYTLIHDDLPCMDNDDYRRGKLSCHQKFDEWVALLAGDALLTLGFKLLSESGNVNTIRDISEAIGSCGVIGGQVVDIEKTRSKARINKRDLDDLIDEDGYVNIYGAGHVKKMARLLTERAKVELKVFGKKAGRLLAIADLIVERKT